MAVRGHLVHHRRDRDLSSATSDLMTCPSVARLSVAAIIRLPSLSAGNDGDDG